MGQWDHQGARRGPDPAADRTGQIHLRPAPGDHGPQVLGGIHQGVAARFPIHHHRRGPVDQQAPAVCGHAPDLAPGSSLDGHGHGHRNRRLVG